MSVQRDPLPSPVVDDRVVGHRVDDRVIEDRIVTTGRRYAFDSVVVGLAGLVLTLLGFVAVTRAGFDGPMNEPVVDVLGFSHTTTLGLIEAAFGITLILCAVATSRSASIFVGLLLGIGAFVAAVQTSTFVDSLAIESSFAWLLVFLAAAVVLVSLLMPRVATRRAHIEQVDAI